MNKPGLPFPELQSGERGSSAQHPKGVLNEVCSRVYHVVLSCLDPHEIMFWLCRCTNLRKQMILLRLLLKTLEIRAVKGLETSGQAAGICQHTRENIRQAKQLH